jgi:hypothetical protein
VVEVEGIADRRGTHALVPQGVDLGVSLPGQFGPASLGGRGLSTYRLVGILRDQWVSSVTSD